MLPYSDSAHELGIALFISGLLGLVVAVSVAYGKKNNSVFPAAAALLLTGAWLAWFYLPTGDLFDCFERGFMILLMVIALVSSFCCLDPREQFVRIIEGKKAWQKTAKSVTIASMIIFFLGMIGQGRF